MDEYEEFLIREDDEFGGAFRTYDFEKSILVQEHPILEEIDSNLEKEKKNYERKKINIIKEYLNHHDYKVRIYALSCIRDMLSTSETTDILIEALNDIDDDVLIEVTSILLINNIKSDSIIEPLTFILKNNRNSEVRLNAAKHLFFLLEKDTLELMFEILENDTDVELCGEIIDILCEKLYQESITLFIKLLNKNKLAIKDPYLYSNMRKELVKALGDYKIEYIKPNIPSLIGKNKSVETLSHGTTLIDQWTHCLLEISIIDDDINVRCQAIESLGQSKKEFVCDTFIQIIENRNDAITDDLVCSAVKSLGRIGNKKAVLPLLEILNELNDNSFRLLHYDVLKSLGEIGDESAFEPMMKILHTIDFDDIFDEIFDDKKRIKSDFVNVITKALAKIKINNIEKE